MRAPNLLRTAAALLAMVGMSGTALAQAMDPRNPTCPASVNFSTYRQMQMSLETLSDGRKVLRLEGQIDEGAPARLRAALDQHAEIDEIWLRSGGGVARAGNEMGRIVRDSGVMTRIPANWACFSACNFVFMGGWHRQVDDGGVFMVHMFTHTGDRQAIRSEISRGEDNAVGLIGDIEQQSALLASEDNDFMIRMGLSRDLLTEVMYRVRAVAEPGVNVPTRRCLNREERLRYNVETQVLG